MKLHSSQRGLRSHLTALSLGLLVAACSSASNNIPPPPLEAQAFVGTVVAATDDVLVSFNAARTAVAAGAERDIVWDGAAVTNLTLTATTAFPANLFLGGAGFRQLVIGGTGEAVAVSQNGFASLPTGGANPSNNGGFGPFSGDANFAVLGSNTVTVNFTLADRVTASLVNGFGVVFTADAAQDMPKVYCVRNFGEEVRQLEDPQIRHFQDQEITLQVRFRTTRNES